MDDFSVSVPYRVFSSRKAQFRSHLGVQLVQYVISSICHIDKHTGKRLYSCLTYVPMVYCLIRHILEAL